MKPAAILLLTCLLMASGPAFAEPAATPSPAPAPSPSPAAEPARNGSKLYGWIQQGYAVNFAHPRDGINYGVNFNWRSNGYRLNQVSVVSERALDQTVRGNVGYRVDLLAGHDAPFIVANGLFSSFTGLDRTSGIGSNGPDSFRKMDAIGIDLPQFYLDVHVPGLITNKGTDLRVGKFYTLMGREVYPAKDTDFYSRTWENFVGTPYTHTGFLATVHAADTLDVVAGVVRGWDVFTDNNGAVSYHGAFIWTSTDQRYNWTTCWITGPEQPHDSHDIRSLVSSYVTARLDKPGKWILSAGGHYASEMNAAVNPATGGHHEAQWSGLSANLFHDVSTRLRLGLRAEWFRDNDGTRTAVFQRPGFAANLYDVTLNANYKLRDNLRIRPELRYDWASHIRPYNGQKDSSQFTPAVDLIWEF